MSRRQLVVLVVLLPLVLIGAYVAGDRMTGSDEEPVGLQISAAGDATAFEHDYRIPPGTADLIERGEPVEIVPAELTVSVGDTIRIVNDDSADHIVGVFFVAAGEVLTQRFNSPGVLEGACSVHSSGEFVLRVEA